MKALILPLILALLLALGFVVVTNKVYQQAAAAGRMAVPQCLWYGSPAEVATRK